MIKSVGDNYRLPNPDRNTRAVQRTFKDRQPEAVGPQPFQPHIPTVVEVHLHAPVQYNTKLCCGNAVTEVFSSVMNHARGYPLCSYQHMLISTHSFISDLTGYRHTDIQTDIQMDKKKERPRSVEGDIVYWEL